MQTQRDMKELKLTKVALIDTRKEKFTGRRIPGLMTHKKGWAISLSETQKKLIKDNFKNAEYLINQIQQEQEGSKKEIISDLEYAINSSLKSDYFKALRLLFNK